MCNKYYLIDGENVNIESLKDMQKLDSSDTVLFFGRKEKKDQSKKMENFKKTCKCKIKTMLVKATTKNALDFQIISYLGILIGQNLDAEYYIVSIDRGYDASIELFKNISNARVSRIPNFNCDNSTIDAGVQVKLNKMYGQKNADIILFTCRRSKNKEDALDKLYLKLPNYKIMKECEKIVEAYFSKESINKEINAAGKLKEQFHKIETCNKILDAMKITNDRGLALDIITNSILTGEQKAYEKLYDAFNAYYQ